MSDGVTDVTWRKGRAGRTVQLEDGAASAVCVLGGRREVTQRRAKTHFGLVQGTEKQRHCADSPGKGGLTSPSGTGNSCSRWNWEFLSLFLHAECALRFELWLNCSLPREASLKPTGRINAPSHLFPELLILLSLTTLTNSGGLSAPSNLVNTSNWVKLCLYPHHSPQHAVPLKTTCGMNERGQTSEVW